MKLVAAFAGLMTVMTSGAMARPKDPLCQPLITFVNSVKPDQSRTLTFHTIWGQNFKGTKTPAIRAKQCNHADYPPAMAVCDQLMNNGATEFAVVNAIATITCLSPDTRLGKKVYLQRILVDMAYGTDDRGSNVSIDFDEDEELGGMVLKITVAGY